VTSASFSFDNASIVHSTTNASTQASRVGHIISASASMSMDDFDRLRMESRQLKAAHEARYGMHMAASRDYSAEESRTVESSVASTRASTRASGGRPSDKGRQGSMSKHSSGKELSHSTSTNVVSNKSRVSSSSNGRRKVKGKKGMVNMTTNGLAKIRGILNMNSNDSSDTMSFYCSDGKTGKAAKQKVSLDRIESSDEGRNDDESDGYSATVMNQVANDKRAGSRAPPQSPMHGKPKTEPIKSVKKAAKSARESMDTATTNMKHGLGPKLEEAAKTAVKVTREGVDVVTKDVAPKIGTGLANTALYTAKGVVKVTQQSVEGVGMMAKDLANAKTPARSNVTRNQRDYHMQEQFQLQKNGGRYADYVHDPYYKVVMTPPPQQPNVSNDNGANMNGNAGKTPYTYCDPKTPACLVGAVTAGRCNLPGTHPESLEFLPDGIPRMLVVPEDWEERAGFVSNGAVAGAGAIGVTGVVGVSGVGGQAVNGGERRISNPIDIDEETETINGEEVDREEMMAIKEGLPSPKNSNGQPPSFHSNDKNGDNGEKDNESDEENAGDAENSEEDENDPRNASMWVAVPADIDEDDEDLLESMHVGDINIGELLNDNNADEQSKEMDLVEFAKEYELNTPTSVGSDTFFVGDVQIGFESPENTKNSVVSGEDTSKILAEDAKRWTPDSKGAESNATGVLEAPAGRKIEDFDVCQKGHPQDPALSDEDSLLSLAKTTTAAVVHDKKKGFETPFSVKKGERQLSFSEFKTMNKQVLFDLETDGDKEVFSKELYSMKPVDGLYLNPSESTELSHEPPVRMVGGPQQELYLNPSESTDLSQFSNWAGPTTKKDQKKEVRHSNDTGASKESKSGKRQLKGRVILVRIKRKISKVAKKGKKMLFLPFMGAKGGASDRSDQLSIMDGSFVVSLPKSNIPIPASPSSSSVSGMSITSSIMTGNVSTTKRIIGAVPPKNGSPTPHQFLYGTINYGIRSMEDSTMDGSDALPPPPANMHLPPLMASCDEEDAVSYLAEAMRQSRGDDDDEDSVLLLVTPKDDGTEECQVISAADGTPVQMRDIIDAGGNSGYSDDVTNSVVKPNNLACLFTDEKGNSVHGTPIQIMDAVEVDGGILLTPQGVKHNNFSNVFRPSTDASSSNLLPGSIIDSDDEDETLLYHDGCTVIHQTSTFGDNTIATMTIKEQHEESLVVKNNEAADIMGIGTPILSPDGPSFSHQAAKNGSFLFSPGNMGRAKPSIRAKERASLKDGKVKPSITMLPTAKQAKKSASMGESSALVIRPSLIRQSYSYESAYLVPADVNLQSSSDSVTLAATDEEDVEEVEGSKQVVSSMTEDRQFSYSTILNQFSMDASSVGILLKDGDEPSVASSPEVSATKSREDEMKTPLVSNAAPKKDYPVTPFPEAGTKAINEDTSPLLVALSSSPSNVSISSFKSARGRKKSSPKSKSVPKSALKTRRGLVKERVSDIQHRIEVTGAVTDVNGRLKRNHSYRLKNSRRMTNGNGVLAPRKAVLQTTCYIRSVPIAIAKSYSKDDFGNDLNQEDSYSINEENDHDENVSHAFKYTTKQVDSFDERSPSSVKGGSGSFSDDHEDNVSYAFKYAGPTDVTKPVDSFDESSPGIVKGGSGSFSDASSYVSETTDSDPFNSLLGKMASEDEQSSCSEDDSHASSAVDDEEEEGEAYDADDSAEKENANANNNLVSPLAHLPFKSSTLVKPTELHQHNHQHDQQQQQQRPGLSPMSTYAPQMQARKWRTMAAAAAEKKDANNGSLNARFRSEKSWKKISGNE